MPPVLTDAHSLREIVQQIADHLGHRFRPDEHERVHAAIRERMTALGLVEVTDYRALLSGGGAEAVREWRAIERLVTIGETYFLRDRGQIALLSDTILPGILRRRARDRAVRIWSAGCSTGEEAYTIALLLGERLGAEIGDWDVRVLATDVNDVALDRARAGVYRAWSFRGVDEAFRDRHFDAVGEVWKLRGDVRKRVSFSRHNLVHDAIPDARLGMSDLDLIVCRNVFIYFDEALAMGVVRRFHDALRPEGVLMTGHAELSPAQMQPFTPRMFPQGVVYERAPASVRSAPAIARAAPPPVAPPAPVARPPSATAAVGLDDSLARAESALARGRAWSALDTLAPLLAGAADARAFVIAGFAAADLGNHEDARRYCERALEVEPFSPAPHYVLARLHEDKGRTEEAIELLRKIVYLDPSQAAAYVDLAHCYQRRGDVQRSRKMFEEARRLLLALPPTARVGPVVGATAGEVLCHVAAQLTRLDVEGAR